MTVPYSVEELRLAARQPSDEYHRHLMTWAADRIVSLEREARSIVDITEPHVCERDYRAGETIPLRIPKRFLPAPADVARNPLQHELLDLITLMPDSQTQEIMDYIMSLREIRAKRDA